MKNRKILAVTLPILAATTVVGSGFAAWYFGTTTTESNGIGVIVAPKIEVGKLSLSYKYKDENSNEIKTTDLQPTTDIKLVLDQGYHGGNDTTKGISFQVKDEAADSKTENDPYLGYVMLDSIGWNYSLTAEEAEKLENAGYDIKFTFKITIADVLTNYLDLKKTGDSNPSYEWATGINFKTEGNVLTSEVTVSKDNISSVSDGTINLASKEETDFTSLDGNIYKENAMFNWQTNKGSDATFTGKPKDNSQVTTMEEKINAAVVGNNGIKFDFSVELTPKIA